MDRLDGLLWANPSFLLHNLYLFQGCHGGYQGIVSQKLSGGKLAPKLVYLVDGTDKGVP